MSLSNLTYAPEINAFLRSISVTGAQLSSLYNTYFNDSPLTGVKSLSSTDSSGLAITAENGDVTLSAPIGNNVTLSGNGGSETINCTQAGIAVNSTATVGITAGNSVALTGAGSQAINISCNTAPTDRILISNGKGNLPNSIYIDTPTGVGAGCTFSPNTVVSCLGGLMGVAGNTANPSPASPWVMSAQNSGGKFGLAQTGILYNINLPLPSNANGMSTSFMLTNPSTGPVVIQTTPPGGTFTGFSLQAGAGVQAVTGTTLTFVGNKAAKGDSVHFASNGTTWMTEIYSSVADGITLTP